MPNQLYNIEDTCHINIICTFIITVAFVTMHKWMCNLNKEIHELQANNYQEMRI